MAGERCIGSRHMEVILFVQTFKLKNKVFTTDIAQLGFKRERFVFKFLAMYFFIGIGECDRMFSDE